MDLYIDSELQDETANRKAIEDLIGAETLNDVLEDIAGSAQVIIDDQYSEHPVGEYVSDTRKPIKHLVTGDSTSPFAFCVQKPGSDKGYSVKLTFSFVEYRKVEPSELKNLFPKT